MIGGEPIIAATQVKREVGKMYVDTFIVNNQLYKDMGVKVVREVSRNEYEEYIQKKFNSPTYISPGLELYFYEVQVD